MIWHCNLFSKWESWDIKSKFKYITTIFRLNKTIKNKETFNKLINKYKYYIYIYSIKKNKFKKIVCEITEKKTILFQKGKKNKQEKKYS